MYFSLKNKVKDDKELEMYLDAFSDDAQTVVRTRRAETAGDWEAFPGSPGSS